MNIAKLIRESQEKNILQYCEKYVKSKEFQKILEKNVRNSIREITEDMDLHEWLPRELVKKFEQKIESAIAKAIGI